MKRFISCDWGTSCLRLALIELPGLAVVAESTTDEGVAAVYRAWQRGNSAGDGRASFYISIVGDKIREWEDGVRLSMKGSPLVISGMASSSLGLVDLPYGKTPFPLNGSTVVVKRISPNSTFAHEVVVISGVTSGRDAMRGEETQLIGCEIMNDERIFICPGTHSKHVLVKANAAVEISTYMTGELLHVLSGHSILSHSVEAHELFSREPFEQGVKEAVDSNFLNKLFSVRMNQLLATFTKAENYDYLSGVLIGTELKDLLGSTRPVTVVGAEYLNRRYAVALSCMGMKNVELVDGRKATIRGQYKILKSLG